MYGSAYMVLLGLCSIGTFSIGTHMVLLGLCSIGTSSIGTIIGAVTP